MLYNNIKILYNNINMNELVSTFLPKGMLSQKFALVMVGIFATAIGAFGMLPPPPKMLVRLVERFPFLQWALMYVLIWQGSGGYDEKLSLFGTAVVYVIYTIMKSYDNEEVVIVEETL